MHCPTKHLLSTIISLPCNLPIDLVSPQKPPALTIFPTYEEIVTHMWKRRHGLPRPIGVIDTINHQILLDRLHSDFGIACLALSWLRSYLSNRPQYVKLGDHTSPSAAILAGVPQGSVLGPLLFTTSVTSVRHS